MFWEPSGTVRTREGEQGQLEPDVSAFGLRVYVATEQSWDAGNVAGGGKSRGRAGSWNSGTEDCDNPGSSSRERAPRCQSEDTGKGTRPGGDVFRKQG